MRVLINHFYCYCFGTFCKCLVIEKCSYPYVLSLVSLVCLGALALAFGFFSCWNFLFGLGVGFFEGESLVGLGFS